MSFTAIKEIINAEIAAEAKAAADINEHIASVGKAFLAKVDAAQNQANAEFDALRDLISNTMNQLATDLASKSAELIGEAPQGQNKEAA